MYGDDQHKYRQYTQPQFFISSHDRFGFYNQMLQKSLAQDSVKRFYSDNKSDETTRWCDEHFV